MDSNTHIFKRKWLGPKDHVTYNSELNPGLCAQFEEGIIIDCEGASILVCDCASLVLGPLLNTFKEKKRDLKIYMIKLLPGENMLHPLAGLFDRRIQFMYLEVGTRASQLQLYSRLPTQLVNKELLSRFSYFFFTCITHVKQTLKIQCKYLLIFFYIYV